MIKAGQLKKLMKIVIIGAKYLLGFVAFISTLINTEVFFPSSFAMIL